jgi:hypothetical protein
MSSDPTLATSNGEELPWPVIPFRRSTPRGHRHHVGVALEEEERHVKPGAELPDVKGHELVESCFSADSNPMVKLLMPRSV